MGSDGGREMNIITKQQFCLKWIKEIQHEFQQRWNIRYPDLTTYSKELDQVHTLIGRYNKMLNEIEHDHEIWEEYITYIQDGQEIEQWDLAGNVLILKDK